METGGNYCGDCGEMIVETGGGGGGGTIMDIKGGGEDTTML